jgi:glycosyltransferase involved in cell wall biosynthesis
MATPYVTVLIPAYNAAATIRRAVDSVLAQTYRNYEIVVIDDASRDATAEIVGTQYGDQVRLLRLPRNLGESGAMNAGIAVAKGDLIAFLDADDEWLPEKLARQAAALERNPNAVLACSGCRFVDATGSQSRDAGIFALSVAPSEVWRLLLAQTLIAKPCVTARAKALSAVGPFDTGLAVGADQDMWIRLAATGEVEFVPEILTVVHDTAGSLTKVYADKIDRYVLPMIRRHIEQQRHRLSRREIRAILGVRYATVGRNLYFAGSLVRGANLLLRAALLGHRVAANLWYLITASPPAKAAKRLARVGADTGELSRKSTA